MGKKKKKTPAYRQKFEKENPVVSARLTRQEAGELDRLKKATGKTNAEIMRLGMRLLQDPHDDWMVGYDEAEDEFKVSFRCARCGRSTAVLTAEQKRMVAEFAQLLGWTHEVCPAEDDEDE